MAQNTVRSWLEKSGLIGVARVGRHPIRAMEARRARSWSARFHRSSESIAQDLNEELWAETLRFASDIEDRHKKTFQELRSSVRLGGGADYRLLYFLTRLMKPGVVVETGVAAGWSSAAFLSAMRVNGHGHLWSSELVYDRPWMGTDYRSFVGMVVDPSLHDRWTLLMDGDRVNLPAILTEVRTVDFFHFDSDKSTAGRRFAFKAVAGHLSTSSIIAFDDIDDNLYFRSLVHELRRPFAVTGPRGTVGLIWDGLPPASSAEGYR